MDELKLVQVFLLQYEIAVYDKLYTDREFYAGNTESSKKLKLLDDSERKHWDTITNTTGAMSKQHIRNACKYLSDP